MIKKFKTTLVGIALLGALALSSTASACATPAEGIQEQGKPRMSDEQREAFKAMPLDEVKANILGKLAKRKLQHKEKVAQDKSDLKSCRKKGGKGHRKEDGMRMKQ